MKLLTLLVVVLALSLCAIGYAKVGMDMKLTFGPSSAGSVGGGYWLLIEGTSDCVLIEGTSDCTILE